MIENSKLPFIVIQIKSYSHQRSKKSVPVHFLPNLGWRNIDNVVNFVIFAERLKSLNYILISIFPEHFHFCLNNFFCGLITNFFTHFIVVFFCFLLLRLSWILILKGICGLSSKVLHSSFPLKNTLWFIFQYLIVTC